MFIDAKNKKFGIVLCVSFNFLFPIILIKPLEHTGFKKIK